MDQAKKQKVIIGVVVVALLGMGSVWFVRRDSGSTQDLSARQGGERRKRASATVDKKKKGRTKRKRATAGKKSTVGRKEREVKERVVKKRKSRKKGSKKKRRKKSLTPAA